MPNTIKSNTDSERNPRQSYNSSGRSMGEHDERERKPSQNLWVGNLSTETTDSDLTDLFGEYGEIDNVTNYAARNFAFLHFKRLDDAKAARDALQGSNLHGNPMKIEYARPAKPGKHLWVGGISSNVTKEQLEDEFLKFGEIEEYRFLGDRNTALIDYFRPEDAAVALKNLNGKRIGGEEIRVDYLRSQRRDNWSDSNDSRDSHYNSKRSMGPSEPFWMPPDAMWNFPDPSQFGHKRHHDSNLLYLINPSSQHSSGRKEVGPSKTLWIHYPSTIQVDEQMLHNAMILFGEIENIRTFPTRHYSFVEFRSVDEARRAKEGLQGRLFNDSRIQIMFSNSGLAPPKDSPGFFPGLQGPGPDMFFNEPPFGPGPMEYIGHNRPMLPNNFPAYLGTNGMPGPNILMRPPFTVGFDQLLSGPDLYADANQNNAMGPNRRKLSPSAAGLLPSPALPGMRPPLWDGSDIIPFQRESKRSRMNSPLPVDDASIPSRKLDNQVKRRDQSNGYQPQPDVGPSGSFGNALGQSFHSPVGTRVPSGGALGQGLPDNDHCWRGVIAKGGTPVCHARCVPLGNGLDSPLPEIVNCSARTGLDMLTKHYTDASGFDIVFFLPDSEDDFASYTEFLRYLGSKNRAGVAKFDDGTTLFLVPPSDFLTKVLNVSGPERLYGVVLKLAHQNPTSAPVIQQQQQRQPQQPQQSIALSSQYNQPPQNNYALLSQKEDQYSRILPENPMLHPPKPPLPRAEESPLVQNVSQDYASSLASHAGISLTPELIATLAALLPSNMQSSFSTSAQISQGSTSFPTSFTPDKAISSQGWRQDQVIPTNSIHNSREESMVLHTSQQLGQQFNSQTTLSSQFPAYMNVTGHSSQPITQDPSLNVPQQVIHSSGPPSNNFALPPQGGQVTVPQQTNQQQYQLDASQNNSQRSYGTVQYSTEATEYYRSPVDQPKPAVLNPSTQSQGVNLSQSHMGMSMVNDKGNNTSFPNQMQQLQSALSGTSQGSADGEADKNQRYQSTLQFAANLLLQIQQQQQGSTQASQGSGNH
ncbi:hypothetical protein GIB67_035503 [Kingdonia uniflora]|uniref:RRM domain-containing protein n=1 Tax=Kingdonia uniflora TaxID=39325 RepID=A0A7J7MC18_9MAGN|nr:hypothetical protein GIB67_035503 [Kingdonia uniflora]